MSKRLRWLALIGCMAFASAYSLPILQVDGNGKLTGATGVDVGGTLYDVVFRDGTCVALFTGCDDAGDFTFQTGAGAAAASQALLDQVLLDVGGFTFDSDPEKTFGCSAAALCATFTPFGISVFVNITGFEALNFNSGDAVEFDVTLSNDNTTFRGSANWAKWAPAAIGSIVCDPITLPGCVNIVENATPEPGTIACLGVGLMALIMTRRRRTQARDHTQ